MKGKPPGGLAGNIASTTLAYPGNSFKYSPKFPTDEPQQKQDVFDMITITTGPQTKAANTTRSACLNRKSNGSIILSTAGKTQKGAAEEDLNAGCLQKQEKLSPVKCDEICSLPEEEMLGPDKEMQENCQIEKVGVDISQKDEKEFEETEHSCKELDEDGPKKHKN